jgi:hypothetical protein
MIANATWWNNTCTAQLNSCDPELRFQLGYELGQEYVNVFPTMFSYTCGDPKDGGCQTVPNLEWPTRGTVTIDPNVPGAYWAYLYGNRDLAPGCYNVLMAREAVISAPPYATICQEWADAKSFQVPS